MSIPNTYVLALKKKNKNFFLSRPPKKFVGGGKPKTIKKQHFFGLAEISGRFFGRKFSKSARQIFLAILTPNFFGFEFGLKTKKLCKFKVRKPKMLKKWFYPPPREMNIPVSGKISWHDKCRTGNVNLWR